LRHFDDPKVAAVAPLVLVWPGDPPVIDSAGDRYYLGGVAAKRGRGEQLGPVYLTSCRVFGASASSAFYRRDLVQRVGGFPESFGAYFEDVDLSFRLNRAGGVVMYEPASRVLHHVSASHGPPAGPLLEQQSRNEERVFWRNVPGREMAHALPRHLAVVAGKAWRRWREGTLIAFLRGRWSVMAEVPGLLRHRRHLQGPGMQSLPDNCLVETRFWG
jgi:GT2 family glycosyltransferase